MGVSTEQVLELLGKAKAAEGDAATSPISGVRGPGTRTSRSESTNLKAQAIELLQQQGAQPLDGGLSPEGQQARQQQRQQPIEPPEPELRPGAGPLGVNINTQDPLAPSKRPVPDAIQKAAKAGVVFDSPAPAGHALASFAIDQEERRKAFETSLRQHFGDPDLDVVIGPETGEIEFLDPRTGKFTLAAPPGKLDTDKIKGAAGNMIPFFLEGIAATGTATVTKSPLLVNLAGAAGAFTGEVTKLLVGQRMGVNSSAEPKDIALAAGKSAGISFGAGFTVDKGVQFVQAMRNLIKKQPVSLAKSAERIGIDLNEAGKLQSEINDVIEAERMRLAARNDDLPESLQAEDIESSRFTITIGEEAANQDLLALQDAVKRSPKFQAAFGEFDNERERALRNFYDIISRPFRTSAAAGRVAAGADEAGGFATVDSAARRGQGGVVEDAAPRPADAGEMSNDVVRRVREIAQQGLRYERRRANEPLARARADAKLATDSVETRPVHELGELARGVGRAEIERFNNLAQQAATRLKSVYGGTPFVRNTEFASSLNTLSEEAKNVLIPAIRQRREQFLPPATETVPGQAPSPIVSATGQPVTPGTAATTRPSRTFDPNTRWTFEEAWATLSGMKQIVRERSAGGATDIPDIGAVKKLIDSMEKDLLSSVGNTPGITPYKDFVNWYRREIQRLNEGTVGRVMKRKGGPNGEFVVNDEDVFRTVFPPGGKTPTRQFMRLIENDPEAIQAFRQTIADDWRRNVVDPNTGRANPTRHEQWLRDHREQLKATFPDGSPLFTPAQMSQINRATGMDNAVVAAERKHKEAIDALNQRFETKIAATSSPQDILNIIQRDLTGQSAKDMVRLLKNSPDLLRGIRAEYMRSMRNRVMTARIPVTQEPILNSKQLDKFLLGNDQAGEAGQLPVIRALFGDEHAKNLQTLQRALQSIRRETNFPNRPNTGFWASVGKNIIRAHVGLFTKPGRFLTAGDQIRGRAANALLSKALMEPNNMKELIKIWDMDMRTRQAGVILEKLGAFELLPGEEAPPLNGQKQQVDRVP